MGASIVIACDRCGATRSVDFNMENARGWEMADATPSLIRDAGWDFMLSRETSEYVYLCPECKAAYDAMRARHEAETREMARRHAAELVGFMTPPPPTVVDE